MNHRPFSALTASLLLILFYQNCGNNAQSLREISTSASTSETPDSANNPSSSTTAGSSTGAGTTSGGNTTGGSTTGGSTTGGSTTGGSTTGGSTTGGSTTGGSTTGGSTTGGSTTGGSTTGGSTTGGSTTGGSTVTWYNSVALFNSNQSLVGSQSVATKFPNSLVGVAGFTVDSVNKKITIHGSNLTLSDFNFSGWDIVVSGTKNIIRNNVFTAGNGFYPLFISTTAIDTLVEFNSFVGPRKAGNIVAPIFIEGKKGLNLTDGARNTILRRNHISGYSADGIKVLSSPTLIEQNLILVNAFTPGSHGDQISIQITKGAWPSGDTVIVQQNYISQVLTPDHWRWSTSARFGGVDTGTNGPNNAIRAVVNTNDTLSAISNLLITQNIIEHDPYIKSFPYQSTNTRTTGIDVIDNAFGPNMNKRYAYPNSNISTWTSNVDMMTFQPLAKP